MLEIARIVGELGVSKGDRIAVVREYTVHRDRVFFGQDMDFLQAQVRFAADAPVGTVGAEIERIGQLFLGGTLTDAA